VAVQYTATKTTTNQIDSMGYNSSEIVIWTAPNTKGSRDSPRVSRRGISQRPHRSKGEE
jgi:hypothetical protein